MKAEMMETIINENKGKNNEIVFYFSKIEERKYDTLQCDIKDLSNVYNNSISFRKNNQKYYLDLNFVKYVEVREKQKSIDFAG